MISHEQKKYNRMIAEKGEKKAQDIFDGFLMGEIDKMVENTSLENVIGLYDRNDPTLSINTPVIPTKPNFLNKKASDLTADELGRVVYANKMYQEEIEKYRVLTMAKSILRGMVYDYLVNLIIAESGVHKLTINGKAISYEKIQSLLAYVKKHGEDDTLDELDIKFNSLVGTLDEIL